MKVEKKYFTRELYEKLADWAAKYKPKRREKIFDTYPYFIKYKRQLKTTGDLIVAISIAYSWMPTMLDMYGQTEKSFDKLKKEISQFKSFSSSALLEENKPMIKKILAKLSRATNNSVVGASKVLHMFYPRHIPILDSRVITAWNKLPKIEKAKIPALNNNNREECYYQYWLGILYWREELKHKGVRRIEKKLFDYGGYLKNKERSKKNG